MSGFERILMRRTGWSGPHANESVDLMNYKEALSYAMDLCAARERCLSEIRDKLHGHKIPSQEIENILLTLKKEKFIDESRYAESFSSDKLRINKWGKVKIRYILQHKNISRQDIGNALDKIDDEFYSSVLREELMKKRKTIKGSNAFELRGKLSRFGQQRGFETGLIYSLLDDILESEA
jgi:regulatory protein